MKLKINVVLIFLLGALSGGAAGAQTSAGGDAYSVIADHYAITTGPPRVEKVSPHVWVAVGYDLANVVLIHTDAGNVIVDTAMSPGRAREIKAAFDKAAPQGPVVAVVYSHSHIDHIGGASVWADENTPIWSTDALPAHLFKQYGLFMPIETIRGGRQFGRRVPLEINRYSALGRQADIDAALENGVLLPTNSFSVSHTLNIGGLEIQLHEAPGETHDTLFVWIPADAAAITGDDFYWSFPNLYTLRGTSPRPVDQWIQSIDTIRALDPEFIVPCHNVPLKGREQVRETLTNYRDAVQWVRDAAVRGANMGMDMDALAESISLPPHLADLEYNKQFYGQVDWSVRAIFTNNLGWFDGRPEELYPVPRAEAARREIELMGGAETVLARAREALAANDPRWAAHLLVKLRDSNSDGPAGEVDELLAQAYEAEAQTTFNTNGRSYLLESAYELRHGLEIPAMPKLNPRLAAAVPLDHIFTILASRLVPEKAMDVLESVQFVFPDEKTKYTVTVRRGIAEVITGDPLPGTPEPVAVITTDAADYRQMALGLQQPAAMFAAGKVKVKGSLPAFMEFMKRFDTGF